MKTKFIYLTYYQVIILMLRLKELRDENPYFSDEIANGFEDYARKRGQEILFTHPIKLRINPNASKYKVSKSLLEYLTRLTSIDVLKKNSLTRYIEKLKNENDNSNQNHELSEETSPQKIK